MEKEFNNVSQERLIFEKKSTFDNPILYVRMGEVDGDRYSAYKDIQETIMLAFDKDRADSVVNQLQDTIELRHYRKIVLDFINYGNEQLVFCATFGEVDNTNKLAVLVNQPRREIGAGKLEFDNLRRLASIDDKSVVAPLAYFQNGAQELIVTPYIDNARCIYGGNKKWGMFDPEPIYHFEEFTPEVSDEIQASMIALLVHYYDHENNTGISKTHLSGDDFITSQNWDSKNSNTILENMKIIAARDVINIPYNQYLDLLRKEFIQGTHYKDNDVIQNKILVNCKSEIPLSIDIIEKGIEIGQNI